MLTRDLLRFKKVDQRIEPPQFIKPTPAVRRICEDLLGYWRAGIGRKRQELEEGSGRVCYRARSLVVARGLQKLVIDACSFTEPDSVGDAALAGRRPRRRACRPDPDKTSDEHRRTIEAELGELDLDRLLYADLPHEAVLDQSPDWPADELIARYNRALVQGWFLGAGELQVVIDDPDTGILSADCQTIAFSSSAGRGGPMEMTASCVCRCLGRARCSIRPIAVVYNWLYSARGGQCQGLADRGTYCQAREAGWWPAGPDPGRSDSQPTSAFLLMYLTTSVASATSCGPASRLELDR